MLFNNDGHILKAITLRLHCVLRVKNECELHYRRTVLNAFREVSDALVPREQIAEIREHQEHEVAPLETVVKLSTERYVAGKPDYYEVLDFHYVFGCWLCQVRNSTFGIRSLATGH